MILLCTESLDGGQGALVTQQVAELESNHTVIVLAPNPHSQPWAEFWELPPRLICLASIGAARQLRRHINSNHPEAVHFHGLRPAILGIGIRGRKVLTYHGSFSPSSIGLVRALFLRILPLLFNDTFSVAPPPAGWRHTPVLSPYAQIDCKSPYPRFIKNKVLPSRVVWAGRLDEPKNPDQLIQAIGLLRDRGFRIPTTIYGEGPQRGELERQVLALGLGDDTIFAGHVKREEMGLSNQDLFVLISDSEGVPLSMEEAMSAGCQVVVSPLTGTKWLGGSSVQFVSSVDEIADAISSACSGDFSADTRAQLSNKFADNDVFEAWHSALCECGVPCPPTT